MITLLHEIIRRTRQHHAIEHATIHILSERLPQQRFSGISGPLGFTIYGEASEEEVRQAVGNALLRLQAGEHNLAVHPYCGTNLVTSGVLATLAAMAVSGGRRNFMERFPIALLLVIAALTLAKPLGFRLQSYTTLANVSDRWVIDIQPFEIGNQTAHRVIFE